MLSVCRVDPLPSPATLSYDLQVFRTDDAIFVRGQLAGSFSVTCSRCLGPCEIQVQEPTLQITYLCPEGEQPEEEELSLEDLDTYSYNGESVDLEPMLREHLVLAVPMAPQCDPRCKGLCSSCGADLNKEPCSCEDAGLESPWVAALSQIKNNNS